jgi:hypothetical protein
LTLLSGPTGEGFVVGKAEWMRNIRILCIYGKGCGLVNADSSMAKEFSPIGVICKVE